MLLPTRTPGLLRPRVPVRPRRSFQQRPIHGQCRAGRASTVSVGPGAQPRTLASLLTHRTCCRSPFPPRWPRVQRKTAKDVTFSERFSAGHVSTPLSQPA